MTIGEEESSPTGIQETRRFSEAVSFPAIAAVKKNLNEAPLNDQTREWVRKGVAEYLREFGTQKAFTALVNMWRGKAVLITPNFTEGEAREVRKVLRALQDSTAALRDGRPDKFNKKIAGQLVERFEERAQEARLTGDEEQAQMLLQAAEEYRDLQGILLKETAERKRA